MNCLCAMYVDRNQRAFLAQMMSFVVRYDVICHSFPFNSQYLMTRGVDIPAVHHTPGCTEGGKNSGKIFQEQAEAFKSYSLIITRSQLTFNSSNHVLMLALNLIIYQ